MRALLAVGLALLTTAPYATAVHGQAYDAFGVGVLPDGSVYDVKVHWSGYQWNTAGCNQCFTVTITQQATGALVVQDQFPGRWTGQGPVFFVGEVLVYHAWADTAYGGSAHFDIKGFQAQQVYNPAPARAFMAYTGNYEAYELVLVVPYGLV